MSKTNVPASSESTSIFSAVLRIFWMIIGNVVLAISTIVILQTHDSLFSVADVIYWVTVPLLILARYLSIAWYAGTTAYGEPATMDHWRRYALIVALVSVLTWLVAHGLARVLPA